MCYGNYIELKYTEPKARKEYYCEWCNEKIVIGEQHFYRVYVFEGEFTTGRMHFECHDTMQKAPHDEVCDGWTQGDFKRGSLELR